MNERVTIQDELDEIETVLQEIHELNALLEMDKPLGLVLRNSDFANKILTHYIDEQCKVIEMEAIKRQKKLKEMLKLEEIYEDSITETRG